MYNGWTESQEQTEARRRRMKARATAQRINANLDELIKGAAQVAQEAQAAQEAERPLTEAEIDAAALAELQNIRAYFADVADQAQAAAATWKAKAAHIRREFAIRAGLIVAAVIVVNGLIAFTRMP